MAGSVREVAAYGGPVDWEAGDSSGGPPVDPSVAARLERAAAAARLETFAAGDSSDTSPAKHVDGDIGPPQRDIRNAVLFERQPGDADAVDSRDVQQGRLGDCYFLAPLAAMAGTAEGRAALQNAIVENKSANGDVVSYTVTFHEHQSSLFGANTTRDVPVTVDRLFVEMQARPRSGGDLNEVWPLVVENAYAKYLGGYANLGGGGDPSTAMTLLTGHPAKQTSLNWPQRLMTPYSEADLKTDLASDKLVVLSTRLRIPQPTGTPETETAHGLTPAHAYFVEGTEEHEGKTFVRLGNAWANAKPALVPFDELTKWFSAVHVGSLK